MIVGNLRTWRGGVSKVWRPLIGYTLLAAAVSLFDAYTDATSFALPALPLSILAATLGILLSFRNSSAYDRWWEARTLWGGVVNVSRTFARQVLVFLPTESPTTSEPEGRRLRASPLQQTALHDGDAPAAWTRTRATDGAVRDRQGAARLTPRNPAYTPVEDRGEQLAHLSTLSADARELVYAQIGWVNALRCHLRRQDPIPEIAPFFRAPVLDALEEEHNVPAAILVWMATRLRRLLTEDAAADDGPPSMDATYRLVALDETLSELTNLLGGCERIKNTPLPRQYDLLPRVMVRVYLGVLPLALIGEIGLLTPLVTAVVGLLFLALDAIGREVEAPFENDIHDTPMTALCRTIEINLRQMLGETTLPKPEQPVDGVLN